MGLATDGDYITCGSENNGLYIYYKVSFQRRPLLVQRCNGTTAGLGYLEVNVICQCKSAPWAVG